MPVTSALTIGTYCSRTERVETAAGEWIARFSSPLTRLCGCRNYDHVFRARRGPRGL